MNSEGLAKLILSEVAPTPAKKSAWLADAEMLGMVTTRCDALLKEIEAGAQKLAAAAEMREVMSRHGLSAAQAVRLLKSGSRSGARTKPRTAGHDIDKKTPSQLAAMLNSIATADKFAGFNALLRGEGLAPVNAGKFSSIVRKAKKAVNRG